MGAEKGPAPDEWRRVETACEENGGESVLFDSTFDSNSLAVDEQRTTFELG